MEKKNQENKLHDLLYSLQVSEFVQTAGEFCIFIENAEQFTKRDFIFKSRELLPLIYYRMINLPELDTYTEEVNEKYVSEQDWDHIYTIILSKMGEHDSFLEVFAPAMQEEEGPVVASIAEHFSDIYQDIKNFITLYNLGDAVIMNDALWECKMNFEEYWGQRLVNALRAIHMLTTGDEKALEEDDAPEEDTSSQFDPEKINTEDWLISKKIKDHERDEQ